MQGGGVLGDGVGEAADGRARVAEAWAACAGAVHRAADDGEVPGAAHGHPGVALRDELREEVELRGVEGELRPLRGEGELEDVGCPIRAVRPIQQLLAVEVIAPIVLPSHTERAEGGERREEGGRCGVRGAGLGSAATMTPSRLSGCTTTSCHMREKPCTMAVLLRVATPCTAVC